MNTNSEEARLDFSVIIPLYNHEMFIQAALASVLEQTFKPVEIIIVDDGSSDQSFRIAEEILRDFHIGKIVRQSNCGAHNALNRAIHLSKCDYIAVLNSDDIFKSEKLKRCAKLFSSNPNFDLIFGRVDIVDQNGNLIIKNETTDWLNICYNDFHNLGSLPLALLKENFAVTTSNFVFTRRVWKLAGGFKNLRYCHDLDFLMAASRFGTIFFDQLEDPHISYRVHPTNTIKENLDQINLEIAAVTAVALEPLTLKIPDTSPDFNTQSELESILQHKSLSSKIASLIPFRRSFDEREVLYNAVSANRTKGRNPHLSQAIETGPIDISRAEKTSESMKKLTIAVELSSFDKGGLEKVVLDSAIDFRRCGVEPIIISCGPVGHLGEIAQKKGIEVVSIPGGDPHSFYESVLRSRKVDISMSHFSYTGYKTFKKLGIPNITFIHNIYAMLRNEALSDFIQSDAHVDRYISVSNLATDYVVGKYGISREKITTIPNGLNIREHQDRKDGTKSDLTKFGIKEGDYVFLNVASYNLHKSHYLMADAMRLILQKRRDIKIICVGNVVYQPHFRQLKADIDNWGLQENILFPGYFDDVAPLHLAADAFLLPSLIEGWSIAMNEAMFYGKPLILTETGGAPQVISNSDIGLLIPNEYGEILNLDSHLLDQIAYDQRRFKTAPYLANAMTTFADNRETWKKKGLRGYQKVLDNYNFWKVTERYISLCYEVLK